MQNGIKGAVNDGQDAVPVIYLLQQYRHFFTGVPAMVALA